jgi:dihydropyrimidinase
MDPDSVGLDQIEELAATGHPSVKVFMSFQRFERRVGDYLEALRRAAAAGSTVLMHCEDAAVIGCCCEVLRRRGDLAPSFYPEARPVHAERAATERAMAFGAATGATIYVVHLSSAAALESCRRARATGVSVHVETRPIYLQLTRERYAEPDGAKYAGAPPLRSEADRDAMWDGAADGAIDTVCTDHAPWTLADKLDPALDATDLRQGMAELETMLPVLWSTGVRTGRLTVERLVSLLSTAPARLFGMYPTKGAVAVGSDADLVVLDPDATRTVDGTAMQSRAGWTPYDGWDLTGWPEVVLSRGEVVVAEGRVLGEPGRGRAVDRHRRDPSPT